MSKLLNDIRVALALAAAMSAVPLAAQTQRAPEQFVQREEAGLELEVVDPTGAACYGAKVQLKDEATQQLIIATTNNDGRLRLSHLTPGTYTITVAHQGFQHYEQVIVVQERKTSDLKAILRVATTTGGLLDDSQVLIPVPEVEVPPLVFEPVPVPDYPPERRPGFLRRAVDKLFHRRHS